MSDTTKLPNRFRDGILWGVLGVIPIPFLFMPLPFSVLICTLLSAGIAGYRGKSFRPAIGAVVTIAIISAVVLSVLYVSISGINQ